MKIYSKCDLNNYSLSLTYDDISLIPAEVSQVKTWSEVNTKSIFLGMEITVPVIASPMDSVTGIEMANELTNLGTIGILNRFDSSLNELFVNGKPLAGIKAVSVSLAAEEKLIEQIAEHKFMVCIDTANANNAHVLKNAKK